MCTRSASGLVAVHLETGRVEVWRSSNSDFLGMLAGNLAGNGDRRGGGGSRWGRLTFRRTGRCWARVYPREEATGGVCLSVGCPGRGGGLRGGRLHLGRGERAKCGSKDPPPLIPVHIGWPDK